MLKSLCWPVQGAAVGWQEPPHNTSAVNTSAHSESSCFAPRLINPWTNFYTFVLREGIDTPYPLSRQCAARPGNSDGLWLSGEQWGGVWMEIGAGLGTVATSRLLQLCWRRRGWRGCLSGLWGRATLRWFLTRTEISKQHPMWQPVPALAVTYPPLWGKLNFHLASVCQVSLLYVPCQNQSKGRVAQCSSSQPAWPPQNISHGGFQAVQDHLCAGFSRLCAEIRCPAHRPALLWKPGPVLPDLSREKIQLQVWGCLCQSSCSNCGSKSSQVSCTSVSIGTWETRGCAISSCCVPLFSCVVISRGTEG